MASKNLPAKVVSEDKRLDNTAKKAGEALGELRWHWTLNEDNPNRVSFAEYARQVGRSSATIEKYAKAYAKVQSTPPGVDFQDAVATASYGEDRAAAVEAYAKAAGISMGSVRRGATPDHAAAVNRVQEIAQRRAEDNGTSVAKEAKAAAEHVIKHRSEDLAAAKARADQANRFRDKQQHTLEWISATGALNYARKSIKEAISHIDGVQFDDEEAETLRQEFARLEAAVKWARLYVTGKADVDWDVELAKLTGGQA